MKAAENGPGRTVSVRLDEDLYDWLSEMRTQMFKDKSIKVSLSAVIKGLLEQARVESSSSRRR